MDAVISVTPQTLENCCAQGRVLQATSGAHMETV